jgi:hypothetical protein
MAPRAKKDEQEVEVAIPTNTETATAPVNEEVVDSTAVTIHKPAHQLATLQEFGSLIEEDANQDLGFEKKDIAIPLIRVLQSNSPQVKRQNAKFIAGAEAGFFFNTATQQVFDGQKGIDFIPVRFNRQATLWRPREESGGGGFEGEIPVQDAEALIAAGRTTKNDKNKDILNAPYRDKPAGLELVISAMYAGLLLIDVSGEEAGEGVTFTPVALPLSSTQMKKARAWNAVIAGARLPNSSGVGTYTPPLYGFVYHLTSVPEQNAKGDWMGVKITQGAPLLKFQKGQVTEGFAGAGQAYMAARDLAKLFTDGGVKIRQEDMHDDVTVTDDGGSMGAETTAEEEAKLPF